MDQFVYIDLPKLNNVMKESKKYSNFVKIKIPKDGSCFFHAILRAISVMYNDEESVIRDENGRERIVKIDRNCFMLNERKRLAKLLASTVTANPGSPTYYDILSRGNIKTLSKTLPKIYSLKSMQENLRNPLEFIGLEYLEFASLVYEIDIYIIYDSI